VRRTRSRGHDAGWADASGVVAAAGACTKKRMRLQ
jgi:hypothetical protein